MGRLVYEFQLINYVDSFLRFKSLDNPYYAHGHNPYYKIAIDNYEPRLYNHILINRGDIILIITHHESRLVNLQEEFLYGMNMRTRKTGKFPDYITENFNDF
jgi:hypothetical protein